MNWGEQSTHDPGECLADGYRIPDRYLAKKRFFMWPELAETVSQASHTTYPLVRIDERDVQLVFLRVRPLCVVHHGDDQPLHLGRGEEHSVLNVGASPGRAPALLLAIHIVAALVEQGVIRAGACGLVHHMRPIVRRIMVMIPCATEIMISLLVTVLMPSPLP